MKRQPQPTTVYKTDRIEVVRLAFREFALWIDGELVSFHDSQHAAEHRGAVTLHEIAADMVAGRMVTK